MQHCDEEDLTLVALGEPTPAVVAEHLGRCATCSTTLAELRDVVALARDGRPQPVVPPPSVWDGIAAATGVTAAPRPERVAAGAAAWTAGAAPRTRSEALSQARPETGSQTPRSAAARRGPTPSDGTRSEAAVVPLRRPRRAPGLRRRTAALLAAACLVVGAGAGAVVTRLVGDRADTGTTVVARTTLAGLAPDPQAAGQVTVVRDAGGGRVLSVDVTRLGGDPDGFYEVWLIDSAVQHLVPLGVLHGSSGTFTLPDGLDLREFPVVDVSVEPLDGNPGHSGRSVLRGSIA